MGRIWKTLLAGLVVVATTAPSYAQVSEDCFRSQALDPYRMLRRLALDINHKMPTYEEYLEMDGLDEVPESTIEAMLNSDRFRIMARRFHEDLLWPNLDGASLTAFNFRIDDNAITKTYRFVSANRQRSFRGQPVTCLDQPQVEYYEGEATFNNGQPSLPYKVPKPININEDEGVWQEGYVCVKPYFGVGMNANNVSKGDCPPGEIKVCAFDAQTATSAPMFRKIQGVPQIEQGVFQLQDGNPMVTDCESSAGPQNLACGAGVGLRISYASGVENTLWEEMREQLGRLIDDHTVGGLPYSEMLTTDRIYMNERLYFFKKYLSKATSPINKTYNEWQEGDAAIPEGELDYENRDFEVTTQDLEMGHSGILTHSAYTLRFQTNRARANRFRTVFTKQYFIPPDDPEDESSGACDPEADDLTQRCTCRYCHQVLEPMAAYWGNISEAGSALLSDPEIFPIYEPLCDHTGEECCRGPGGTSFVPEGTCAGQVKGVTECPDAACARFYVNDPEQPNPGVLIPYQFAYTAEGAEPLDAYYQGIADHIETGPKSFAESVIDSGQFHSAMVQNLFEYLMGRSMILDPSRPDNEIDILTTLKEEFEGHDDFRLIVKSLVMLEQYGRVR
jgi:hypothetical protein